MVGTYRSSTQKASGFREAAAWFRPQMKELASLIWPTHCLHCEDVVEDGAGFCPACWRDVTWCHGVCCYGCGAPVPPGPPNEAPEDVICDNCVERRPLWHHARAVMLYDGAGRRLVLGLKNSGKANIVAHIGRWMAERAEDLITPESVIIPVPVHPKRLRERGFNQSALVARAMVRHARLGQYRPTALRRTAYGPKLAMMPSASERYEAVKDGFVTNIAEHGVLADAHVVLVDDVLTSGATLDACTQMLLSAGVRRVDVMVVARQCRRLDNGALVARPINAATSAMLSKPFKAARLD